MKASALDWNELPNFSPDEWPEGTLNRMQGGIIQALQDVRRHTGALHPSPVASAHVRDSGTSRHSTEGGRLSDATDLFLEWRHVSDTVAECLAHPDIQGVGLYDSMVYRGDDPGEWAMIHIDTRPREEAACWKGEGRDPVGYTTVRPGELMRWAVRLQVENAL